MTQDFSDLKSYPPTPEPRHSLAKRILLAIAFVIAIPFVGLFVSAVGLVTGLGTILGGAIAIGTLILLLLGNEPSVRLVSLCVGSGLLALALGAVHVWLFSEEIPRKRRPL